ncbi:heptahelical transmembrane protein 1 isoform X3 [Rosa chinensis]|uniref:heptahelical transmembrane protein 1 isoform X3 n=1 Tax=Rosa chinensis TaxID=74649 RepID=UPI000D086F3E|nr:heptahelical transmembrane protein 1 isoform X3 [Rosa chinensis]
MSPGEGGGGAAVNFRKRSKRRSNNAAGATKDQPQNHEDSCYYQSSSSSSSSASNYESKKKRIRKKKGKGNNNNVRGSSKRFELMSYWELPEYMKDNEFILNYYRADWPVLEALFSVFRWHNETLNVWTHLIGFVLFVGLTMANLWEVPQVADLLGFFNRSTFSAAANVSHNFSAEMNNIASPGDRLSVALWPFYVFLAGSMFCLLSSSICHLFSCHSHPLNVLLLRIDYAGITTMIITSFFPPIYYIFQCDPRWQFIYLGGITLMGICTIITLFSPKLSSSKFRTFRALLFASLGLFGIVPAVHASVVNWGNPKRDITLVYEVAMALFYLTGTGFYITRIPERWRPGCFDLAGHSHQIFHVLVVMGALAHYAAILVMLDWRSTLGCDINITL